MKINIYFLFSCPILGVEGHWIERNHGGQADCDGGEVMVAACSSGRNHDCPSRNGGGRVSYSIQCERLDGGWFDKRDCVGKDSNRDAKTNLKCTSGSEEISFEKQDVKTIRCGDHGTPVSCHEGEVITDICTSGKEDDYKGRFGCGGDTYTAIRCGKLRYTPSTLSPSATPSEAIVTDSPHLQNCIEDSKITLEETHESYKVEDATIKVLAIDGKVTEFSDFSTNKGNNVIYKKACENKPGGKYMELTYKMTCNSQNEQLDVFVVKHPRCFSSACSAADQDALLQEFDIKTTENRNQDMNGVTWSCTDVELVDETPSVCQFETDALSNADSILFARSENLDPKVKQKKILFVSVSNAFEATFPPSLDYTGACKDEGGDPTAIFTTLACDKKKNKEPAPKGLAESTRNARGVTRGLARGNAKKQEQKILHVKNFPVCFGESCDGFGATSKVTIAAQFRSAKAGFVDGMHRDRRSVD